MEFRAEGCLPFLPIFQDYVVRVQEHSMLMTPKTSSELVIVNWKNNKVRTSDT